ncbi:MAG: M24 family metallopeptidase [Actinomycetota bacterium]
MRTGDPVRTWIYGPVWEGYWLDLGRTVVAGGKPSGAQRRWIGAANDGVMKLIEEIRPEPERAQGRRARRPAPPGDRHG